MLLSRSTLAGVAVALALGGSCLAGEEQTASKAPVRIVPLLELRSNAAPPALRLRSFQGSPATVDRHGIIRDLMGRPIGYWGIENSSDIRMDVPVTPRR